MLFRSPQRKANVIVIDKVVNDLGCGVKALKPTTKGFYWSNLHTMFTGAGAASESKIPHFHLRTQVSEHVLFRLKHE